MQKSPRSNSKVKKNDSRNESNLEAQETALSKGAQERACDTRNSDRRAVLHPVDIRNPTP